MLTFHAGAAAADITPPVGWPLQGFGPDYGVSTGVHDPILARALVLGMGEARFAIVAVDLCGLPRRDCEAAAAAAARAAGMPAAHVSICASHNHHSPAIANLYTDNRVTSDTYVSQVRAGIAAAVGRAAARLEPALMHTGATEAALNLNRRVEMPDGTVKDLPWNRHLRPNGPVDRQIIALRFVAAREPRRTIATIYNYSSHAVCAGAHITETTADFPGVASALLEASAGGTALFLNGACGNVHPVAFEKGYPEMEAMGRALARKVNACLHAAPEPAPVAALAQAARNVRVPIQTARVPTLKAEHLPAGRFDGATIETPVRALRIGDTAVALVPCECFVEFGMRIKRESPFPTTIAATIANDYMDYAPTPEQFQKGGYEVRSTIFTDQSGRIIADAAMGLLRELAAQA